MWMRWLIEHDFAFNTAERTTTTTATATKTSLLERENDKDAM
jgi:hypothetical protein